MNRLFLIVLIFPVAACSESKNSSSASGDFSLSACEQFAYEKNLDWRRGACHHHLGYKWAEENMPHRYSECESGIKGQEDYADGCKKWIKENTR